MTGRRILVGGLAAGIALALMLALPGVFRSDTAPTEAFDPPTNANWVAIDCDLVTAGVQDNCSFAPGASADVGIVFGNVVGLGGNNAAQELAAFNFDLVNSDGAVLDPTTPSCSPPSLDCNPDFNQATVTGGGWSCSPPAPSPDVDASPTTTTSRLACINGSLDGNSVPDNSTILLAVVHYDAGTEGLSSLSLAGVSVGNADQAVVAACNPDTDATGAVCGTANVTVAPPPAFTMSIDCDVAAAGIQVACNPSAGPYAVDVVVTNNSGGSVQIGAFGFNLIANQAVLNPVIVAPCDASGLDCNPDFNQAIITGGFACAPPPPVADANADPAIADSMIGCFNGAADGPIMAAGSTLPIARVNYAAANGTTALTINDGNFYDESFTELGSCPTISIPMACPQTNVTVGAVVPTATNTSPATNTATNTPTATNTVPGPTNTSTNTATNTPTNTATNTATNTPTPTNTVEGPTNTATNTPTATNTVEGPTNTPTNTAVPTDTPTATNTTEAPTETPTPESLAYTMSIDCDVVAAGIQLACNPSGGAYAVDIVVTNNTAGAIQIGAFGFNIIANQAVLNPVVVAPCDASGLDCNPDFNQAAITGGFACSPPAPVADNNADPAIADSMLGCFNGAVDGPMLAGGASVVLGRVNYTATDGVTALTIADGNFYDESFGELGSCNELISVPMTCPQTNVTVGQVAATPTPTNTTEADTPTATNTVEGPTNTATNTPTATNTVEGPTNTATNTPTATNTVEGPTNTPTNTAVPTDTPTATNTPEESATPEVTRTVEVTRTAEVTRTVETTRTVEVTETVETTETPEVTPTEQIKTHTPTVEVATETPEVTTTNTPGTTSTVTITTTPTEQIRTHTPVPTETEDNPTLTSTVVSTTTRPASTVTAVSTVSGITTGPNPGGAGGATALPNSGQGDSGQASDWMVGILSIMAAGIGLYGVVVWRRRRA